MSTTTHATTPDRLLEMAYDMEQKGNLTLAAGLRKMAHDPDFRATVARLLAEEESDAYLEARAAVARELDEVLAVRLEPTYRDPANDDYTAEPIGPVAYIDYHYGNGDDEVALCIDIDRQDAPSVLWCGDDAIDLDRALRTAANLFTLLSTDEVRAALAADAERRRERAA